MNIGIDIRPLMIGQRTGVGEYTYELLNAIFNIDRTNQYFLYYNSGNDVSNQIPRWQYDNVHYVSTRYPNKLFNASQIILGRPKLDKVVIENYKIENSLEIGNWKLEINQWFSPNLNFTSLSASTKHLLTIHDLSFEFYPEFYTPKQRLWHQIINPRKQCQRADMILTPSENTKRDIVEYYGIPSEKIKVIYPGLGGRGTRDEGQGVTKLDVLKKYDLSNNFILFLGTIEPRKNIVGLVEAFEIFSRSPVPCPSSHCPTLVIAGAPGWNNKEIFARINQSPYKSKIKYIGYVAPEDKPALYAAAELFVYPSFYEGFGFPVLEAMAMGTPVITSNRSSLPEITAGAAHLTNPNKPAEIAAGIKQILSDPQLKNRLIQSGLQQAQKFNWQTAAQQWLNLLKD